MGCWRDAVLLVKPDTTVRWHREGSGATRAPTEEWTAQQLPRATPFTFGPQLLIRDGDAKYGTAFARVAEGAQIEVVKIAPGVSSRLPESRLTLG